MTFLVLNNESYAAVGAAVRRFWGGDAAGAHYPAKDIAGVDIATVAGGFGLWSRRVRTVGEAGEAFEHSRSVAGPTLIEVMTDPDDPGTCRWAQPEPVGERLASSGLFARCLNSVAPHAAQEHKAGRSIQWRAIDGGPRAT